MRKPNPNDLGDLFEPYPDACPVRSRLQRRRFYGYRCRLCGDTYVQTHDGRGSESMLDHAEAHRAETAELRRALRSDPNLNAGRGRLDIRGASDE